MVFRRPAQGFEPEGVGARYKAASGLCLALVCVGFSRRVPIAQLFPAATAEGLVILDKSFDLLLGAILLIALAQLEGRKLFDFGVVYPSGFDGMYGLILGTIVAGVILALRLVLPRSAEARADIGETLARMGAEAWMAVFFLAALGEEVVYRALLGRYLERLTGSTYVAILLSSVAFAIAHSSLGLLAMMNAMICGIFLGAAFFLYSRSLALVCVAHFVMNVLIFLVELH